MIRQRANLGGWSRTCRKNSEYLGRIEPHGLTPVMVDDETVLYEASAINIYLAEKAGSDLLGANEQERHQVLQWRNASANPQYHGICSRAWPQLGLERAVEFCARSVEAARMTPMELA